ncbi:triphosphoribosyl-dephospho-CoA synthase [Jeotgalibacillus marinus]|uniref:triphosphoribosyl-dephospho-CoA synthase n=1 Tax=Jeotgalibacillus marinus TaxID=86667 RepID=A0ABV3Q7U0_9BACL
MNNDKQTFSLTAAKVAKRSLIEEVELTPKPGLVDRSNTGAHQDLTLQLMTTSAEALTDTFEKIAFISYDCSPSSSLREEIAAIGRDGEKRMFEVTGGVNTHKGAIWAIGLLVSAASMGKGMYTVEENVTLAGELARLPDRYCPATKTNGGNVTAKYGVGGARGEAQQGFPHITQCSLPMLKRSRADGLTEEKARLNALLALIAHLDDTCILHRGGPEALSFAKKQAALFLTNGKIDYLNTLDEDFTRRNISPGGSADLLAATLFLDKIQTYKTEDKVRREYEYTI